MRIDYLATLSDLRTGLTAVEDELGDLVYLELGTKQKPSFAVVQSFDMLANLGISSSTAAGMGGAFEICRASEFTLQAEMSPARETGASTGVFVSDFPHCLGGIYFAPSFRYSKDQRKLVPGVISSSEANESRRLFRAFKKIFLRSFEKHWIWYVGPDALRCARSGTTLIAMDVNERPEQHVRPE